MNELCEGLGDSQSLFRVYIQNRPNVTLPCAANRFHPVNEGEIQQIGQSCGNGWRKVFNVYAKLFYALPRAHFPLAEHITSWQQYRDKRLLQPNSNTALIFTQPKLNLPNTLHIVMGRTYAKRLDIGMQLDWLNNEFAIDRKQHIIVCPYFDYRQLSNVKIMFLVELIISLQQPLFSAQ